MQAQDVMTTKVVTARPDTSVRDLAKLMVENRISGLPVVDEGGRLVGMVTDGDLYRRPEIDSEKRRGHWLEIFGIKGTQASDYVEAHGRVARDVMTTNVIAVAPGATLRQIAELFETKHIRRVPVVVKDAVVGIVSRANLVQVLAATAEESLERGLNDRRLRDLVLAEYRRLPRCFPGEGNVVVTDGVVHLWGDLPSRTELDALRLAAEGIPGVKRFEDHTYRTFGDPGLEPRSQSTVSVTGPEEGF